MKAIMLVLSSLIFSSVALACPDISGEFSCKSKRNSTSIIIEAIQNGYTINTDGMVADFIADGKSYDLPSTDSMTDAKKITSCKDDKLIIDFNATLLYEGAVIGKEVLKAAYYMEGSNLKIVRKTKVKGMPLPVQDYTCTRI